MRAPARTRLARASVRAYAQGNADVDNAIHLFRRAKPTEHQHLMQEESLRSAGLLEEKVVKSGNYLQQGSPRQKAFLNDLATVFGSTWMTPAEIRKVPVGSGFKMVSGSTSHSGKRLLDIVMNETGRLAAIAESNSQAQQSTGHSVDLATQLLASLKQTAKHQLVTQCLAEEPEKQTGDNGYDFAKIRADNGGVLPDCVVCCCEVGTNGAIVSYPCHGKAPHLVCSGCCTQTANQWDASTCPQCRGTVGHLLFLDGTGQVVQKAALPTKGQAVTISQVVTPLLPFNHAGPYWSSISPQRPAAAAANSAIAATIAPQPATTPVSGAGAPVKKPDFAAQAKQELAAMSTKDLQGFVDRLHVACQAKGVDIAATLQNAPDIISMIPMLLQELQSSRKRQKAVTGKRARNQEVSVIYMPMPRDDSE